MAVASQPVEIRRDKIEIPLEHDGYGLFGFKIDSFQEEFVAETLLVCGLEQARPQGPVNLDGATDDFFR